MVATINLPKEEYLKLITGQYLNMVFPVMDDCEGYCFASIDPLTNGEKIKAAFPDRSDWTGNLGYEIVHFVQLPGCLLVNTYTEEWWNSVGEVSNTILEQIEEGEQSHED